MEWPLHVSLILILVLLIVLCVALWHQTGRQWHQTGRQRRKRGQGKQLRAAANSSRRQWHQTGRQRRERGQGKRLRAAANSSRGQQVTLKKQNKQQRRQQVQVDSKIALGVKHLYEHYGEEWINNAGRARLALAIDEMFGPVRLKNSMLMPVWLRNHTAREQRTLAGAILEAVLERKAEIARRRKMEHQQQVRHQIGSLEEPQVGLHVDMTLAENPVVTEDVSTEDEDYYTEDSNDVDGIDDVDDVDLDIS